MKLIHTWQYRRASQAMSAEGAMLAEIAELRTALEQKDKVLSALLEDDSHGFPIAQMPSYLRNWVRSVITGAKND